MFNSIGLQLPDRHCAVEDLGSNSLSDHPKVKGLVLGLALENFCCDLVSLAHFGTHSKGVRHSTSCPDQIMMQDNLWANLWIFYP